MRRLLFSSIVCGSALVSACQEGGNEVDPDGGNSNNHSDQNEQTESDMNNSDNSENDPDHNNEENENNQNGNQSNGNGDAEKVSFTEEAAVDLLHTYEETLTAYFDEAMENAQEVPSVDTIGEVENTLLDFMSQEEADFHLDTYFREEDGSVIVVSTEAPVWFEESRDYTFEHEEDTARITQERDNELIGHINMLYDFQYAEDEDAWQIETIESEQLNDENG